MLVQNQVKRSLQRHFPEVVTLLAAEPTASRTALADTLCDRLGFFDAKGRRQRSSCLKALRELEMSGRLSLPARKRPGPSQRSPRRLEKPVPEPIDVPKCVGLIKDLRLRKVVNDRDYRIWNEMVIGEHPLGERPLVGRQLRYLIESEHGFLGAIGFASSALNLRHRDRWIGWDEGLRRDHLDKVVCMSRYLIRPKVKCANLASKVLAMVAKIFPVDYEECYGYRPWLLESFVDREYHSGACYQAANWHRVGQTCGRGRQDRARQASESIKDVYIYILDQDFREHMGLPDPLEHQALIPGEGLEREHWAANEFGDAQLGDKRLTKRLVSIAETIGESLGVPFLQTVAGDGAATSGYYRFVDKPDDSEVCMENILAPHRQRTLRRMQGQQQVLCIHDTTDLNYATLTACKGLGVIGKNQTKTESGGLRLHSSFVVTAQEGLPLGIFNFKCYAPKLKPQHKKKDSRYIPIEEKETYRWITSLIDCMAMDKELAETEVIHVMDREADFFDLFDQWRNRGHDDLVVRAKHNRITPDGRKLFTTVESKEADACIEVEIPRKSARGKRGKNVAQPARPKRRGILALRWMKTKVCPAKHGLNSKKPPVDIWILHAKEENPPADVKNPVEWRLLTTIEIDGVETAQNVLNFYAKRWRIEDWHRILKTCCRVEEPAHHDAECLKRLVAINMVIAWRVHLMTLLGREAPELPMETLFSDLEIKVLHLFAKQQRWNMPQHLGDAVTIVARMGGYMNRKHDAPPGAEILSRGLNRLILLSQGLALVQLE